MGKLQVKEFNNAFGSSIDECNEFLSKIPASSVKEVISFYNTMLGDINYVVVYIDK